ncbi:methyltransferase domain-containing protein [Micrococcoides hystricis]|uniref:Methyltransferase domain-containing protein n=1 Tax=Micrococcoides hystricis TaxID=1572761 RepID=A0ABV6PBG5_9MICC
MTQLFQRAAHDWLTLRQKPDARARERARDLITTLNEHFADSTEITILDLGAGSGANMLWLSQHLPTPQRWRLIDRDAELLEAAQHVQAPPHVLGVEAELRSLDELTVDEVSEADLVTASAVLDVLSFAQLDGLADLLSHAQVPALFSLNVTGKVEFSPDEPLDHELTEAFNEHQHRSGLAGPQAATYLAEKLEAAGLRVLTADTDWLEGTNSREHQSDEAFVDRYLTERVAAALEQRPDLAEDAAAWLRQRQTQLSQGTLTVRVGHHDILVLPA